MKTIDMIRPLTTLLMTGVVLSAAALGADHFAANSRLAQGRWVKVSVSETGIYEIGRAQLAQMGFSDPSRVKVYGYGGKMIGEVLNNSLPDDLQQVPALRTGDKVCFYGIGQVSLSLTQSGSNTLFKRERNTYSTRGYYFLTDDDTESALALQVKPLDESASQPLTTSYDYLLHEQELSSLSHTGSELLGEDITQGLRSFPFKLINASSDEMFLTTRLAAKISRVTAGDKTSDLRGRFRCYLTTDGTTTELPYDDVTGYVKGCTRDHGFYETAESTIPVTIATSDGNGALRYKVEVTSASGAMQVATLDYFIITYLHDNTLTDQPANQCLMAYTTTTANAMVKVDGSTTALVWDVTDKTCPVSMQTTLVDRTVLFTPGQQNAPREYIAFDPNATLLQIDDFQIVENQNLHALPVPELLIITNSTFMPEAERVAQLHRIHDGIDVLVVDQEQVFNEFSSGTPSAMAYRLLCKMFYDRDNTRFKNLLLFGHCSFDNRGIVSGKKDRLICYETTQSNDDETSHVIDDFFGYLNDNSGIVLSADQLKIGIGRIPCSSLTEAKSDVDKLYEYILSPDYGPWRNNYFIWSERSTTAENKLHEKQADGISYLMENGLNVKMMADRCFVGMFPGNVAETYKASEKRSSSEAKRHILEMLNEGQYFGTYVGHAGPNTLTGSSMWRSNDVVDNDYVHLPIMTTACCDVARFDSDHAGIAEKMFHQRNGGAIALYTTSRQVYANSNDFLNRAFVKAMFSYDRNKTMPTLGEAYMASKLSYGNVSNSNKLNWLLLGDPAMRVNYPKPLFQITKINTTAITETNEVTVRPMQRMQIEAKVMDENNPDQVNTAFNGDATITLYDIKRNFMTVNGTGDYDSETHTIYYPQEMLARVSGRVTNGVFKGSIVIPRNERSKGGKCTITTYAHQDNSEEMVNGIFDRLVVSTYNGANAIVDTEAPVVTAMYLNDETSFDAGAQVGSDAMLYIRATDNTAFNLQQQSLGQGMQLKLDKGKKSYNLVKNHATVSNEGRTLEIAMPVTGLTPGRHTLDFSVCDVSGNRTQHSVAFIVSDNIDLTLTASERAGCEQAEISLEEHKLSSQPTLNMKVINLKGELVWSQSVSRFPFTWDLTDNSGARVKPGLYKIYGNYEHEDGYGGTNIVSFIVLNPLEN